MNIDKVVEEVIDEVAAKTRAAADAELFVHVDESLKRLPTCPSRPGNRFGHDIITPPHLRKKGM